MQLPEDFTPDYTFVNTIELYCNHNSKIFLRNNLAYVSLNSRVNVWNVATGELVSTLGSRNKAVTALAVMGENAVIGYEDGLIEITKDGSSEPTQVRLHTRRITKIFPLPSSFLSSSTDGTIVEYDMVLCQVVKKYSVRSSLPIFSVVSGESAGDSNRSVWGVCSNNMVTAWRVGSDRVYAALCLESAVVGIVPLTALSAILFLKNGSSVAVTAKEAEAERRPFLSFKPIRRVVCDANQVLVQTTKNKVLLFDIKSDRSGLDLKLSEKLPEDVVDIGFSGGKVVYITKSNSLCVLNGAKHTGAHTSSISSLYVYDHSDVSRTEPGQKHQLIYSLSRDSVSVFVKNAESQLPFRLGELKASSILNSDKKLPGIVSLALFKDKVVVTDGSSLYFFSLDLSQQEGALAIGEDGCGEGEDSKSLSVSHLVSSAEYLAVVAADHILFYDSSPKAVRSIRLPEAATFAAFSPDSTLFCAALINNRIEVYDTATGALKLSLYGHSLPPRHFSISHDSKLLVSCGADRLVKLWGLDYGECLKTFLNDAGSAEFICGKKYVFASNRALNYCDGTKLLKRIKYAVDDGPLAVGNDFIVARAGTGIAYFAMEKYEMLAESESEEEGDQFARKEIPIACSDSYDRFISFLEQMADDSGSLQKIDDSLYSLLESLEADELSAYLCVLDSLSVHTLVKFLVRNIERNPVINARIFLGLCSEHMPTCKSNSSFCELRERILESTERLRELVGTNVARISMSVEGFEL